MIYLVSGYMFLFIFRPYEYWPALGDFRIERIYILLLMAAILFWRDRRYVPHPVTRYLLGFLLVMAIASFYAIKPGEAFLATFDFFKVVVFFFIIILTVRNEEDLKKFMIAYLAIMTIYVGKSAWEFFIHDRHVYRMGIRRMIGVDISYGDPNSFAASIAYSLPFLWAMIRLNLKQRWLRILLWGYAVLAAVAVVFTGSRSGMVTCLFFLMLLWWGSPRKLVGGVLLTVLLAGAWLKMPEDLKTRFLSTFGQASQQAEARWAEESAAGRIEGLKQGWRIFLRHPVIGIGPDNFRYGWEDPRKSAQSHNLFGQTLGETGAMGLVAFIALVWQIYRTHRRNFLQAGELERAGPDGEGGPVFLKAMATASMQALLLLLFNGNFGHNLYRYNWLWIAAIGILSAHFLALRAAARAPAAEPEEIEVAARPGRSLAGQA